MFFPTLLNEINISPQALRLYVELTFEPNRDDDTLAADCFGLDEPPGPTLAGAINELRARRMLYQTREPMAPSFWDFRTTHREPIDLTHPRNPGYMELQNQPKHLAMSTPTFRLLFWLLCQPSPQTATLPEPGHIHLTETQFAKAIDELGARNLLPKTDDEIDLTEE